MRPLAQQDQRPDDERLDDELRWWLVTDGKLVWWLASDGKWYPGTSDDAVRAPASLAEVDRSGFGLAALAIGIIVTLAGLIPLLLFIGWALAQR
jgi:hypothetical protein